VTDETPAENTAEKQRVRNKCLHAIGTLGYVVPAQAENYFCQHQFALCTSAPCIPEPGNPKVAMCTCARFTLPPHQDQLSRADYLA
jgi:hypothetical protein